MVELDATNGDTIRTAVDDGLKKLGEDCRREDVLVLLTDKAPYMKRAGEHVFIHNLILIFYDLLLQGFKFYIVSLRIQKNINQFAIDTISLKKIIRLQFMNHVL